MSGNNEMNRQAFGRFYLRSSSKASGYERYRLEPADNVKKSFLNLICHMCRLYLRIFDLTLTMSIKLAIMKDIKSKIWKGVGRTRELPVVLHVVN